MILNYNEIRSEFIEDYKEYKNENMSNKEALARTSYDYETVAMKGELQKAAVKISYGELFLAQEKVLNTAKEKLIRDLKDLNLKKIQEGLTKEEYEDFTEKLNFILEMIGNIDTTSYNRVCWYYKEFNQVVNEFMESQIRRNTTVEDLVQSTLRRFERDCNNTKSEKTIVYVSILENVLNYNLMTEKGVLKELLDFVKVFEPETINNEQLNRREEKYLLSRVDILKNRLTEESYI